MNPGANRPPLREESNLPLAISLAESLQFFHLLLLRSAVGGGVWVRVKERVRTRKVKYSCNSGLNPSHFIISRGKNKQLNSQRTEFDVEVRSG